MESRRRPVDRSGYPTAEVGAFVEKRTKIYPAEERFLGDWLDPTAVTLEGGTGSGRLSAHLSSVGFSGLVGFDIDEGVLGRAGKVLPEVSLVVQDARTLAFREGAFDQIFYLQQLLCFISPGVDRTRAVTEAARVTADGGIGLFSFLLPEAREGRLGRRLFLAWIGMLRRITGSTRPKHEVPWMRIAGRINLWALVDRPPYLRWFDPAEVVELFVDSGWTITSIGSSVQVLSDQMALHPAQLVGRPLDGGLFCVCVRNPRANPLYQEVKPPSTTRF
jgi:SAM-dependent methyltransferase